MTGDQPCGWRDAKRSGFVVSLLIVNLLCLGKLREGASDINCAAPHNNTQLNHAKLTRPGPSYDRGPAEELHASPQLTNLASRLPCIYSDSVDCFKFIRLVRFGNVVFCAKFKRANDILLCNPAGPNNHRHIQSPAHSISDSVKPVCMLAFTPLCAPRTSYSRKRHMLNSVDSEIWSPGSSDTTRPGEMKIAILLPAGWNACQVIN